jgi:hypothetical protein
MTWIAVAVGAVAAIGGAAISADASRRASHAQADAANRATDTQVDMFNTVNEQQAPWRAAGESSLSEILKGFGDGGYFNHQFGAADLKANLAPNYEFMRDQGIGATTNMANAMGGLGGNSLAEISKFTTGYAGNAYQQAYQNYTANQTNIFNRLASIAGLGQTAGSNQNTGASTFAGNIAGAQMGAGNAAAAGTVGAANAWSGGLNNAMGWYQLNNMMNSGSGRVSVPGQMAPISEPSYTPIYQGLD